jgi:hypothetical protein
MQAAVPSRNKKGGLPVSRDLVRIIRESSKITDPSSVSIHEHMQAVENRQGKAIEFYLRACALRLGQAD